MEGQRNCGFAGQADALIATIVSRGPESNKFVWFRIATVVSRSGLLGAFAVVLA
jgi:hypothetical protein